MVGMKLLALLPLLVACAVSPAAPRVHVVVPDGAAALVEYTEGANAWAALGFGASFDDSGLLECPRGWHAMTPPVVDCQISLGILRVPLLEEKSGGAAGLTDTSTAPATIMIDARFAGFDLIMIAAHEAGHVVLDTAHHAPAGTHAIMAPSVNDWVMQPADYELACESIGLGC